LVEAPPELGLGAAEAGQDFAEGVGQFCWVIRAPVGKRCARLVPDALVGVEFGSIGRQRFNAYSLAAAQEGAHVVSLVATTVVPDDDHEAAQVFQQMPKENGDLSVVEVGVRQAAEIQTEAVSLRADGEG